MVQYGLFYNWAAVMNGASQTNANPSGVQGICPNGWHVPSRAELEELVDYVSSIPSYCCNGTAGRIAKALASRVGWYNSSSSCAPGNNQLQNNASHFNAMPSGYKYNGTSNSGVKDYAIFSSTTNGASNTYHYSLNLYYSDAGITMDNYAYKYYAYSVRCVLNEE